MLQSCPPLTGVSWALATSEIIFQWPVDGLLVVYLSVTCRLMVCQLSVTCLLRAVASQERVCQGLITEETCMLNPRMHIRLSTINLCSAFPLPTRGLGKL